MKKIWYTHTHAHTHTHTHTRAHTMEYYSAIKKNEILPFAAMSMDLENIMLSEISQSQILYDIIYMWNLKNNTIECIYKTETHRHRKQTCGYQRGKGSGEGQIKGMGLRHTNYYVENR